MNRIQFYSLTSVLKSILPKILSIVDDNMSVKRSKFWHLFVFYDIIRL